MIDDVGFPDPHQCQFCGEEEVLEAFDWCPKDWGWVLVEVVDECR